MTKFRFDFITARIDPAAVATVAETARVMSEVKQSADGLGDWLVPMLLCAVVGLCAYVVWMRFKQRKEGWA